MRLPQTHHLLRVNASSVCLKRIMHFLAMHDAFFIVSFSEEEP